MCACVCARLKSQKQLRPMGEMMNFILIKYGTMNANWFGTFSLNNHYPFRLNTHAHAPRTHNEMGIGYYCSAAAHFDFSISRLIRCFACVVDGLHINIHSMWIIFSLVRSFGCCCCCCRFCFCFCLVVLRTQNANQNDLAPIWIRP